MDNWFGGRKAASRCLLSNVTEEAGNDEEHRICILTRPCWERGGSCGVGGKNKRKKSLGYLEKCVYR